MKKIIILFAFFFAVQLQAQKDDTVFEFDASQSMCMTGKGTGQDAAINPYMDGNSIAIVENLGKNAFSVRIEYQGKLFLTESIKGTETKEIALRKGSVLYIDSNDKATARVTFKDGKE